MALDQPSDPERLIGGMLAAGRIAIGAAIWLAPRRSLPLMGFRGSADDPRALTLARIAATRDVVLGVWQASSLRDRELLRPATFAVAACDAGDSVAFASPVVRREAPRLAAAGLAAALPATIAGAWVASRLRHR